MNKYKLLLVGSLVAVGVMVLLATSINQRRAEKVVINTSPVVKEKGVESKNEEWAKRYPRQYDSWKKTRKNDNIQDMLKEKPQLAILWAGYGFAKDYNAPRGHAYALQSNQNTLRTGAPLDKKSGPMPTACWTCKSPDVARLFDEVGEMEYYTGKWAKYGNEVVNSIGCADCHDSKTANLKLTRPYLKKGLQDLGVKVENVTHQEMKSLVCAQCHSEYYFKKTEWTDAKGKKKIAKVVTFPWAEGLKAEDMEKYYDSINFKDWTHKISKAPMLKAQHPGYEISQTGIHAQRGVSCTDCHMPYKREGSIKFSDHYIKNPLDNMANSCMNCHRQSESELKDIVNRKFERKEQLMEIAMDNLAKAHLEAGKAWELGATEADMKEILQNIRHGQWKWDYAIASHGSFFHAPEETLRLLAVANETAQNVRLKLVRVLAKYGAIDYIAPDFSTKEKAQSLAGVPLQKLIKDKEQFKATLLKEWNKQAVKKGLLNMESRKGMSDNSSYSK
ncbi:Cytochrome c552 precursor [hydrothermal vent metagenome]|uniref:nitrite reductase (cytochrome; ammonia-forming) n=1 Tax=hydrothermal vent metagenome TaxID=652676 RepID=A0A3B1E177_9ZZZZ